MTSSARHPSRDEAAANEREIQRCVQFALRTVLPDRIQQERRRERRYPFPYPVRMEPVDVDGERVGEPFVAIGKHITNHGLDFYYHRSISYRRVVARFESSPGQDVELLMVLTWCRFGQHGWYENGGRFLAAALRDGRCEPSHDTVTAGLTMELSQEPAGLLLGQ